MNIHEFSNLIAQKRRELDALLRRTLPVKVGNMAKAHYQDNFRNQSFTDNGKQPWPKTRRQLSGDKSAASNYGALLSSRNHLYSSVKYTPSDYRVRVANDLEYAAIHNDGGTTNPTVTPKMRRFAWAMYFKHKKGMLPDAAGKWKALALTKKSRLTIRIPQRQFIGESAELNEQIRNKIDSEINNILNKE
ncbi:MAG: phage virion morphogenesis protein [Tannerellaceae bacterium]|nr:phage virion morphogenesis protein [Tannerellaceae bacterium]